MSHGSSTLVRRFSSAQIQGSWLATTNIGKDIRGGDIGWPKASVHLFFYRSNSRYHNRNTSNSDEPNSRPAPTRRSSQSSPWKPQQQHQPSNHNRLSPTYLKSSKQDDDFPPWQADPGVEDPGQRLRRLVRDAGLAFSNSMIPLARTRAGNAHARQYRNPAGLGVMIQWRHVIHPWSMRFLLDKQHSYEKLTLRRYMEKRKEPLWWFVMLYGDKEAVGSPYVKSTMIRRVEMSWKVALKRKGFDPQGRPLADAEGQNKRERPLHGSVRFSGHFTKVLEMKVEEIADSMVDIVDVLVQELDGRDDVHQGTMPGISHNWRNKDFNKGHKEHRKITTFNR